MTKTKNIIIPIICILSVAAFAAILIIPQSREWFNGATSAHPYLSGFVKFAVLATVGEILAKRMAGGEWIVPNKVIARFIIWGLIGMWITYMMKLLGGGVVFMMDGGLLPCPDKDSFFYTAVKAFFISVTMNTTFGPTFMACHKISDRILDLRTAKEKVTMSSVIGGIDWKRFVSFTILKTVPFFWIPAHTITFMLPAQYQVLVAAALSMALGIILNLGARNKKTQRES